MVVDILRHLPPLALAVSRGVCKAWRAVVDDHRLLRADLLPLSLGGVIYDKNDSDMALFAWRPTANAVIEHELHHRLRPPGPGLRRVDYPRCKFQIWLLYEKTCGTLEWMFKDKINLKSISRSFHDNGPWIMHENDDMGWLLKTDVNLKFINEYNEALAKDDFQWDSDDENAVAVEDCTKKCPPSLRAYDILFCLGLHPYKEIVLFHDESYTNSVFAYHLNSSKVRYIGNMNDRSCLLTMI
ncbi:hypothetical protein BRADI_2g14705v3 [Brachypodium distachyon]|uniref:F-box domain-containing protein n=1 Tax=Brachypodium distachyon TaxID=15368 RepID=A0A0Q3FZ18_BRADI|nr:hypothetical protein BRADI_2g14705v3 [Brachypodium distachyon]